MKIKLIALALALLSLGTPAASAQVNMEFVNVGDTGNLNDTVTASDGSGLHFGGVSYDYAIGKYEVTLNQYKDFLNAVAVTDTYNLYNTSMGTDPNIKGIMRSGSSGSYSYSVIGDGNRPVTYVTWFRAARFANWLNNGQPSGIGEVAGSTEDGAYTLNGITSGGLTISKNANAQYWIPSENEWCKAAYYDPVNDGADANGTVNYWLYPTQSDTAPGNIVGALPNQANYFTDQGSNVFSLTQSATYDPSLNYLTPVGAYTSSASHYGTFDQGGLLWEWNDSVIGVIRGLRGNSWSIWQEAAALQSTWRGYSDPTYEVNYIGFRVATVPEPSTFALLGAGVLSLLAWRRRAP